MDNYTYKDFEEVMDKLVTGVGNIMDNMTDEIVEGILEIYIEKYGNTNAPPKKYIKVAFLLWCLKVGTEFGNDNDKKLAELRSFKS